LKIKTLIYKKQRTHTLEGLLGLVMIEKEERKRKGKEGIDRAVHYIGLIESV
jgi:hypothetical protein